MQPNGQECLQCLFNETEYLPTGEAVFGGKYQGAKWTHKGSNGQLILSRWPIKDIRCTRLSFVFFSFIPFFLSFLLFLFISFSHSSVFLYFCLSFLSSTLIFPFFSSDFFSQVKLTSSDSFLANRVNIHATIKGLFLLPFIFWFPLSFKKQILLCSNFFSLLVSSSPLFFFLFFTHFFLLVCDFFLFFL